MNQFFIQIKNIFKKIYPLASFSIIIILIVIFLFVRNNNELGIARGAFGDEYKEGELIIKFKHILLSKEEQQLLETFGAQIKDEISQIQTKIITVPVQQEKVIQAIFARSPLVEFVELNYLAHGGLIPNDPNYPDQWHHLKISDPQGWDISVGTTTIPIAVIDSGVNPTHPDLSSKLLLGWSFLTNTSDTHDVLGHGTAVAGTAAALTNNSIGVAGVAWQNPIVPLVVLNSSNFATYSNIAKAVTYAADHGIRVLNISIGGSSYSSTLQDAINYAWGKGAIVFASAMNNNWDTPVYPAAMNNVVAVAATDQNDAKASFSNYGNWIDVAAPGVDIFTTNNSGSYGYRKGTSFASPMAAALAALTLSVNPSLTNSQIVDIIEKNTDDLGNAGFDTIFGWGRINIYKTLTAAGVPLATDTTYPTTAITFPADGSTVSGIVTVSASASDDVGVSSVELWKDNALFAKTPFSPYSFSWDTTKDTNGSHTLVSKAYDAAGNIGTSSPITVSVNNPKVISDITPPTVTITNPADNSTLPSVYVIISVSASDNVGVKKIGISFDNILKKTCQSTTNITSCGHAILTSGVSTGAHTIGASATDAAGNTATASITVKK